MELLLVPAVFSSTLIGCLISRIFLPTYKPMWADLTLKISLGAGLGVGVTSCLFFVTRLILGPSNVAALITELLALGAAALALWFVQETRVVETAGANPSGWSWLLLAALLGSLTVAGALFADSSAANPYGAWDAWSIWNLRARFLAQPDASWKRAFSPALNHIAGGGAMHPEYPMLLSGYIARCWTLIGSIGGVAAPIATAALFFTTTLGLLVSALAILRGWSAAMLGGLILLGTTGFLKDGPWQYADVPLAFYYLAAFALLFLADAASQRRGRIVALAGLTIGFAASTKDEGLLFALLLSFAFLGYVTMTGNADRSKAVGSFAAGAAAPLALVLCFRFLLAPPIATPVRVASAAHQMIEGSRYLQIARAFWDEGIALGSGIAHPVLSLAIMGVCLGTRRRRPVMIVSLIALLTLFAAYFFAYVITPMDLSWHLGTSLGRLYVQLWPSLIFLVLAAFVAVEETKAAPVSVTKAKKAKDRAQKSR